MVYLNGVIQVYLELAEKYGLTHCFAVDPDKGFCAHLLTKSHVVACAYNITGELPIDALRVEMERVICDLIEKEQA